MGMYERLFRRAVFIKIVEFPTESSLWAAFISRVVLQCARALMTRYW